MGPFLPMILSTQSGSCVNEPWLSLVIFLGNNLFSGEKIISPLRNTAFLTLFM
jgi:hypothetical protein